MSKVEFERSEENGMLIIDENSVYEIDEECLKKRNISSECKVIEKIKEHKEKEFEQKRKKKR